MSRAAPEILYAQQQGWEITRTRKQHVRFSREGHLVHGAGTASDWRAGKNVMALLRRCEQGLCRCRGVKCD